MNSRYLAPATIADGPSAVGHYSQATNWTDNESQLMVLDRVVAAGKWQCPAIFQGMVSTPAATAYLIQEADRMLSNPA